MRLTFQFLVSPLPSLVCFLLKCTWFEMKWYAMFNLYIVLYWTIPINCTDPMMYFAFQAERFHISSYQDRFASFAGMSEIPDEMAWLTETSSSYYHLNLQAKRFALKLRT